MIDLQFTTSINFGSGNIPAVKRMLRNLKAILSGTVTMLAKPSKKAHKAQLEP